MSFYKADHWRSAIINAPMKEIISQYGFGGYLYRYCLKVEKGVRFQTLLVYGKMTNYMYLSKP
ncbi:hypothetical protein GT348_04335 [Aristophania vespae]|uniref:Uncharacterized protein n=1 Tax=Aristophania vespae TaxID=2697033 RepID=A0A6P1NB33_9PROT|nr:hypothetical protein [Aristophania vespae]QHI95596.1 hypothetical protein GT348_04335 [Aristophania vespae]